MFDQIKDLYKLKQQAAELQKQMAQVISTGTSGLVTIKINGNQELVEVAITENGELDRPQLARDFKTAFTRAQDEVKKTMAARFKDLI